MKKTLLLAALLAAGSANAATVSYSHTTTASTAPFSDTFTLSLFDTTMGTLDAVSIALASSVTGEIDVFNATGSNKSFINASATVPVTVTGPGATALSVNATATLAAGSAAPGFNTYTGITGNLSNLVNISSVNFGAYEGVGSTTGTFTVAAGNGVFSGTSVPGVFFSGSAVADGNVTVTYTYHTTSPVPEADSYAFLALGMGLVGLLARRRAVK